MATRTERKTLVRQNLNNIQGEFASAYENGGKSAATALLAEKRKASPQQSHMFLRAFKSVSYVAGLYQV